MVDILFIAPLVDDKAVANAKDGFSTKFCTHFGTESFGGNFATFQTANLDKFVVIKRHCNFVEYAGCKFALANNYCWAKCICHSFQSATLF